MRVFVGEAPLCYHCTQCVKENLSNFGQLLCDTGHCKMKLDCLAVWENRCVPNNPISEQLRREAEKLRETATDLLEHAALLIAKSVELERRIMARDIPKKGGKP